MTDMRTIDMGSKIGMGMNGMEGVDMNGKSGIGMDGMSGIGMDGMSSVDMSGTLKSEDKEHGRSDWTEATSQEASTCIRRALTQEKNSCTSLIIAPNKPGYRSVRGEVLEYRGCTGGFGDAYSCEYFYASLYRYLYPWPLWLKYMRSEIKTRKLTQVLTVARTLTTGE